VTYRRLTNGIAVIHVGVKDEYAQGTPSKA